METPFIPGLKLSELLYMQAVAPIMAAHFPQVAYAAARLDWGSDVLGFDTSRSTDHGWGPRLQLFVDEEDYAEYHDTIMRALSEALPYTIAGYSTNFGSADLGNSWLVPIASGPVTHGVQVWTVRSFFRDYLNIDIVAVSVADWLAIPQQRLRTVAAGSVFHDRLGALERIRARLRWYPRDVWLYMLAAQWRRIAQEEPFMARCGDAGDELGSRIIAARLVRELIWLCFLMEKTYAPYSKWFGTAFARLLCARTLAPIFDDVLRATAWPEREAHLSQAYAVVATMHNALAITAPMPTAVAPFYERPYLVIGGDAFADAIRAAIVDEQVRRLPPQIGSVDQFVDSTDALGSREYLDHLKALYQETHHAQS